MGHNKLWEILKEMGISGHLMCLQRNLYAGQEAIVRTGHGTMDWFQIGNVKAIYCHPACVIYMQSVVLVSVVQLFATPWIVAHQAPLSMEFSRQGY